MEVGFKIRRLLVVSVRGGCRSVCNHPLLVGVACFLFLLYRSSPWLFSLLVSASPVLVCTVLLLGTLLSFGQPNIPEIERDEASFSNEIVPLKTGLCENATFVTRIEECSSESLSCEKKNESKERVVVKGIGVDGADDAVEKDGGLLENARPVENTSRDIQFDRTVLREDVTEKSDMENENNISVHDEKNGIESVSWSHGDGENQNRSIEEEVYHTIEVENGNSEREPSDDHLEIQSESQWKEVDEVDDEDDVSMDSGSEHAESSSPDASMDGIRPMLDELHPLLDDEEELLVADLTHENSDIASEHSDGSKSENLESDEDSKNGEAGNDDDGDNLEEEEEAQGGKDDESKTAITWTEDDQKNLMDLGSLELERNQRLENLIARRRARKNMGFMAEKSLIDLDYIDLPFNVPHIATMRQNPFDSSDDFYSTVGLPPIPGSAPSVMLKRRNPFDLPYAPHEEKPDLKGDSFQQEFTTHQQRDAIFRRHESFGVGPSNLGIFRKEKQDIKWRPYFVPEHFSADEPNDHPIQRQFSEVSDSKASSDPDTESVASLTDQDYKNANELDSFKEAEAVSCLDQDSLHIEHGTESSEDFNSPDIEKDIDLQGKNVIMLGNTETQDEPESSFSEAMTAELNSSKEVEYVSCFDEASLRVELGTESSEDFNSPDVEEAEKDISFQDENVIMLGNVETQDEPESSFSEAITAELDSSKEVESVSCFDETSLHVELGTESSEDFNSPDVEEAEKDISFLDENVITLGNAETWDEPESSYSEAMNASLDSNSDGSPSTADTVGEESSSKASSSFYSEVNESVPDVKMEENGRPTADVDAKSHSTNEHEGEDVNFSFPRETVEDNQQREPVYDTSPPATERFHSFSPFPSDMHVGMVGRGPTPEVVQNSSDKTQGESMQKNIPDYEERFASDSLLHTQNGNRSVNQEVTEVMEDGMHEANSSLVNGEIGNQNGPEPSIERTSTSSSSTPSWDDSIAEGIIHRQGSHDDVECFDAAHHPSGERRDGFISPSSLKESEVFELERLPSNEIEHEPTIAVDLGPKEGVDLGEIVVTEQGEALPSATDGPVQESTELKFDSVLPEKTKLHSDVPANICDPFPQDQFDERDMAASYQHHFLSEETELSPRNDQETSLEHGSVPVIHPVSLVNSESVADCLNVEQEDIHAEHGVYSSDVKEDANLIRKVDLEAANIPSKKEPSKSEDFQHQGNSVIIEESVHEGKDADEDDTLEILETGATSLSGTSTTSPHSVSTSDGTLDFLSPTGTLYYSDDSVRRVGFVTHDRVLEYSEHMEEASESVGDIRGKETSDRFAGADVEPFADDHADGTGLPSFPSETGKARSTEDTSQASVQIHKGANADVKMVSESSSSNLDHGELKNQVEEISDFSEIRHVEVEETSDGVEEFSPVSDHSNGLPVMEADEMSSSSHVNTFNEVAAAVADTAMMVESYDLERSLIREGANVEELILPSHAEDKTDKDEPQSIEKTSPGLQVVEQTSLDNSVDENDQRLDNTHSEDRLAEDVASEVNNSADSSDADDAESDFEKSRNDCFEKAGASIGSDSTPTMSVHEATARGDIGTTNGLSYSEANAEDDVLPFVSSDPSVKELGRHDGIGSTTRDIGSRETVHSLKEGTVEADKVVHTGDASGTVETAWEVAADNMKYLGVEPNPHKSDSSDGLMPEFNGELLHK